MKQRMESALIVALGISLASLAGCTTMILAMDPKVPTGVAERVPYSIGLYLAPEFERFHGIIKRGLDDSDYDLGSASKALFLETFLRLARGAVVVDRKPPYRGPAEPAVAIVIEPQITGFDVDQPRVSWTPSYLAHIGYRAIVYNRAGVVLLDKIYRGDGETRGTGNKDLAGDYATTAAIAMSVAVAAIVKDVSQFPVTS